MPNKLSTNAKDLIKQLLNKDPMTRLGAGKLDSEEIKSHKFFGSIDWDDVYNRKLEHSIPQVKVFGMPPPQLEDKVYGSYKNIGSVDPNKIDLMETFIKNE